MPTAAAAWKAVADGKPIGFTFQTAEKTYADYAFTAHNPGGHSSKPRPDNAIYELSDALARLSHYRLSRSSTTPPAPTSTCASAANRARWAMRCGPG